MHIAHMLKCEACNYF